MPLIELNEAQVDMARRARLSELEVRMIKASDLPHTIQFKIGVAFGICDHIAREPDARPPTDGQAA